MKKILSSLISVAIMASTFVIASASTKPYVDVTVKEVSYDTYNTFVTNYTGAAAAADEIPYEITLDFKNLPDLTWGNFTGTTGVRVDTLVLDLYVDDFSKIKSVYALDNGISGYGLGAENYGKLSGYAASANKIKQAIAVTAGTGKPQTSYPTSQADQNNDVDGVLSGAIVLYVSVSEPITINKVVSDITIWNNNVQENTVDTKDGLSIAIGKAEEEPTTNEQYFYATVEAIKHNYLEFQFDSNDDDKEADKGYSYEVGSLSIGENDSLTVGLQYTGTQTLELIDVIWSDEYKNN